MCLFLLQMLCEEQGFFLEIVDIIQGFGLNILKGVMEACESKIWARFIVEAEVKIKIKKNTIYLCVCEYFHMRVFFSFSLF